MKKKLLFSSRCPMVAQKWLAGFALVVWGSVSAQNFVRNPDFEEPLGPDNWTVEYAGVTGTPYIHQPTNSGPNDFKIKGRTRMAHKDLAKPNSGTWDGAPTFWNKFGGHFQPNHSWLMHAYFKQVVTNLTPLASYACSAWMTQMDPSNTNNDKIQIYMETLGGPNLTLSKRTEYVTGNSHNNPAGWQRYTATNTASTNGQIELRLHFIKIKTSANWSYRQINAFYDHVAVMPAGQTDYTPPYKILAFERTNQDVFLKWESVMNGRYRIQYSTNLSNLVSWSWVEWSPYLDTNLFATGTSYTFGTNLASLFSFDPLFDPSAPLFFRIYSEPFVP